MKLNELPAIPPKVLLYGTYGTGKSALTMTLGQRLEMLDLNNGLRTGLTLKDAHTTARQSIEVTQFIDKDPRMTLYGNLKMKVLDISNRCTARTYPYQAVGIDCLTDLSSMALRYVMGNSGKRDQFDGKSGAPAPEIQHWGAMFNEITSLLLIIKSLPIAVVLIAHDQRDQIDGVPFTEIGISGKNMPNQVASYFDEVWYTRARPAAGGRMAYTVQTLASATITARTRFNVPDGTDQSIGMIEILRKAGYEFPSIAGKDGPK